MPLYNQNTTKKEVHIMKNETRKHLHELIDKLSDSQIARLYQLIRGMFGKTL